MSIIRKVKAVERVFACLDKEIRQFQLDTGLHCLSGCGKCCTKPDIEASPLEFLPVAFEWFVSGHGYEMLEVLEKESSPICILYSPLSLQNQTSGSCGNYAYRGLICRLFGYAASRDKMGQLRIVACKLIKEQISEFEQAQKKVSNGEYIPVFTDYYKRLMQIDFRLGNQFYPINQAMKVALETVLQHYAYRPFPRMRKAS